MIAEIMSHTLVVSGVLTLMGFAAEAYLRGRSRPLRLAWAAAMGWSSLLLIGLLVTAGMPPRQAEPVREGEYSALGGAVTVFVHPEANNLRSHPEMIPFSLLTLPVRVWDSSVDALGAASRGGAEVLGNSPLGDLGLGVVWATLAGGALLLVALSAVRLRRRTRGLPLEGVGGRTVSVDESLGPAVVGILRPTIVLPRWLLAAPAETLAIVVAHEEEHLRARDTLLLAAALAAVVLAPWNPFFWIQLRRLRLAIELDCDRRVVARGIAPTRYAALLLDLGNRPASLPAGATALAEPPALLERRMKSLCTPVRRMSPLRASLVGTTALLLLIAACSAPVREVPGEVIPAPSRSGTIEPIRVEVEAQPTAAAGQAGPLRANASTEQERPCFDLPDQDLRICGERMVVSTLSNGDGGIAPGDGLTVTAPGFIARSDGRFTQYGRNPDAAVPATEEITVIGYGRQQPAPAPAPQPAPSREPTSGSVAPAGDYIVVQGYGANARVITPPSPMEIFISENLQNISTRPATTGEVVVVGYGANERAPSPDTVDNVAPEPAGNAQNPQATAPEQSGLPVFIRVDRYPEVRNVPEIQQALVREYPADLRNSGIGGRIIMNVFVNASGTVGDCRIGESSRYVSLDQAALRICQVYLFNPAQLNGEPTAVWVQIPITFSSRTQPVPNQPLP